MGASSPTLLLLLLPMLAEGLLGGSSKTAEATPLDKVALKKEVVSMFRHAFDSYMRYAWPADELMPLSCKGRVRGLTPSRGDVDDSLGNFSLTLVDTLDTLVVLGLYDEFELAVTRVIRTVRFDSDLVVSVFETNIRVVGGLLGAHLMAKALQTAQPQRMPWYTDQLLRMAHDAGTRLLPAFNTTTGMPYPRINLKYGMIGALRSQRDTCTACAGTMVLEFAALSRLTGDPVFEAKAHKAMDFLWAQRHRGSDLMGTVLNVMNGDWVRRDSGIGAGIDSYYEYCFKAYMLLGDQAYLHRFNRHYDAVMKYVNQGPLFVDVHMHKPLVASRNFMDSLLAFWPGLQVMSGDLKPAIEIHEMLYQVVQKHRFLPEAFTHDFQIHWGQYPLRPEFIESTYFLYKATKDPHYLEVGRAAMEAMNRFVRVPCGFAGVKDVRTMAHEDRMDSFLLAETFKYLYLLFAEAEDLVFDPDSYVFTTEAHPLPLSIADVPCGPDSAVPGALFRPSRAPREAERSCPNSRSTFKGEVAAYARHLRSNLKGFVNNAQRAPQQAQCQKKPGPSDSLVGGVAESGPALRFEELEAALRGLADAAGRPFQLLGDLFRQPMTSSLKASDFSAGNPAHVAELRRMGIHLEAGTDGRVQLIHSAAAAESTEWAGAGLRFMQDMVALAKEQEEETPHPPRVVQLLSRPHLGQPSFTASPAQFGPPLTAFGVHGGVVEAQPPNACVPLTNQQEVAGRIALVYRSGCMFVEKVALAEAAGAVGVVVVDNVAGSSSATQPLFAMSGDGGKTAVGIPAVFLFAAEGAALLAALRRSPGLLLRLADRPLNPARLHRELFTGEELFPTEPHCLAPEAEELPRATPGEPKFIQIYRNEAGETCVKGSDEEEQCFPEEDLRTPPPSGEDRLVKAAESRLEPRAPDPSPTPPNDIPVPSSPKQAPRDTAEILRRGASHQEQHVTLVDTSVVAVAVSETGVRHLKFKFGAFIRPGKGGEAAEAGVEEILRRMEAETNLGDLPTAFRATVRRIALMSAGQDSPIEASDDANLSQLAVLLAARIPPRQGPADIPKASSPSPPSPARAQRQWRPHSPNLYEFRQKLKEEAEASEASEEQPARKPPREPVRIDESMRCQADAHGTVHCAPRTP